MIIKKFTGKDEQTAMQLAQNELGASVVVMNVRNVKRTGIMRFFKPQLVEVTVGLEEEQDRIQAVKAEAEKALSEKEVREQLKEAVIQGAKEKERNMAKREEKTAPTPADELKIKERLDTLQTLLEKQIEKPDGDAKAAKPKEPEMPEDNEHVRFIKLLYNTMLENEVDEKYANLIVDDLDRSAKPNLPIDALLANVYQKTILRFGEPSGISPAKKGPKVVFFVGPTGVGKTTTIAKLASKFRVEENKKVVMLTADTYRIAATEQLRTYANILEVPFQIVYNGEEMQENLKIYKDVDYVLVDTAGHSHRNEAQKEATSELVHSVDKVAEKEVYLVVSATTKYSDLVSIAEAYQKMTDFKIIFTKLDETDCYGNLLNLKLHTGAELSYITCGQNVPDDIESFNPQRTVKTLLGGK